MFKLENFEEDKNQFLENLNYQISKKCGFYKKIPYFYQNEERYNYNIGFTEKIVLLKNNKEGKRSENSYNVMRKELENLVEKYKSKQKIHALD